MTIGGGEAADQMVRMMLSSGEVTVRLAGSALKNLLALTMALAKDHKVLSGKVNMGKMLKETRDLRLFPMTPEQYKQFQKLAKKQKILFSAIKDRDGKGKLVDVVMPVTELDRANLIFERILYRGPNQAPEREQQPERDHSERSPEQERETPQQARESPQEGRSEEGRPRTPAGEGKPVRAGIQAGMADRTQEAAGRPVGDAAKKRSSVGTRLARYQNQILFTQNLQRRQDDE